MQGNHLSFVPPQFMTPVLEAAGQFVFYRCLFTSASCQIANVRFCGRCERVWRYSFLTVGDYTAYPARDCTTEPLATMKTANKARYPSLANGRICQVKYDILHYKRFPFARRSRRLHTAARPKCSLLAMMLESLSRLSPVFHTNRW